MFFLFHLFTITYLKNIYKNNCVNLVLDLKARCRGAKYLHETLKILPQKPDPIVIEQIAQHLGSIGAIHQTQPELNPG